MSEQVVFYRLLLGRLEEALKSAITHKGSLGSAASFASGACAFNAFLNLLPDLMLEEVEKQELARELQKISTKARDAQLYDFALQADDVRSELIGERQCRIRNHW